MGHLNAYVSSEYPVVYTVLSGEEVEGIPDGRSGIAIALLIGGTPTFLATHVVDDEEVASVGSSLESGNVRVTAVGVPIKVEGDDDEPVRHHPGAFLSLLCADGRRLTVARILGTDPGQPPEELARYVIRQISRGVQLTALESSSGPPTL